MFGPVLVLIVSALSWAEGAEILAVMTFPAMSHLKVIRPLFRELASRGHNVTVITPFTMEDPPRNYREIHVANYNDAIREMIGLDKEAEFLQNPLRASPLFAMREIALMVQERVMQEESLQALLASDSKFDLVLSESTFLQEGLLPLRHRFGAVGVEFLSFPNYHWANWLLGIPYDSSYIVDLSVPYSDRMSFSQRLHNTASSLVTRALWYLYYLPKQQALADAHLRYPGWEARPSLADSLRDTSIVLVNTHPALNYPYPFPPHVIPVGGLNLQPPASLPKDIQKFMDEATDGVILMSFGSHIQVSSTLGEHFGRAFSNVFSRLKQRVLWKWETDFPNPPKNVLVSKWLPQNEVLAHKKMRVFITQGGFVSMTEAMVNGVPLIGIPILGDQHKNVNQFAIKEYGVLLEYSNITEASISWAIDQVLSNPKYKKSTERQKEIFLDKPTSALETAVFWVEYALRHGGAAHLRPAVTRLAWYQQALLDVYLALGLLTLGPLYLLYLLVASLLGRLRKNDSAKKKTS